MLTVSEFTALQFATVLGDYLADWTVVACTLCGRETLVHGGWRPCGSDGWVWLETGLAGGKTSLLSLTDTSTGPCQCIGLR